MPAKKYHVVLTDEEKAQLNELVSKGHASVRELNRARILLKADAGWKDDAISAAVDVSLSTVGRTRKQFINRGLNAATKRKKPEREYAPLLDGRAEAHLIALVCGPPPDGRRRWSLRLLAEQLVALDDIELAAVSHETIRRTLKKTNLSLGASNNG